MKNIDNVTTRLPFKVPEGYFESLPQTIIDHTMNASRRKKMFYRYYGVAAACSLLLTVGGYLGYSYRTRSVATIRIDGYESYISAQVDESQLMDMYIDNRGYTPIKSKK